MINEMTLRVMAKQVEEVNRDKGWYDKKVPFAQALALLHEEAAEAGHAWRQWGFADMTPAQGDPVVDGSRPGEKPGLYMRGYQLPKPEGVASELADVLIRWLDYDTRFKMLGIEYLEGSTGVFALDEDFLTNINTLHGLIARVSWAQEAGYESPAGAFASVLQFAMELADDCGYDLEAEYMRKLAYNKTRPYQHGNRRA
jgi:NTP pyrophosphatase (non-canonical NTP hydrolase)